MQSAMPLSVALPVSLIPPERKRKLQMSTRSRHKERQVEVPPLEIPPPPQDTMPVAVVVVEKEEVVSSYTSSAVPALLGDDDGEGEEDDAEDEIQELGDTLTSAQTDEDVFVLTNDDMATMSLKDLRFLCVSKNLSPHGKKSELMKRIRDAA